MSKFDIASDVDMRCQHDRFATREYADGMSGSSTTSEPAFGADPKPYYLAIGVLVLLEFARRAFLGFVPDDFTAYLNAADLFWAGQNPYSDAMFDGARWNGKPYNYFPGTLYLIVWMAWIPTALTVAIDFVARMAALFFALRYLHRRIVPDAKFQFVLLVALFWEPLMIDVLFGNLASYLLAAWAATAYISERDPSKARLAGAFGTGLVLAFKPFWFAPAAYNFWVRRHWSGLVALVSGGAVVLLLSLLHLDWADTFFAHTQTMREYYFSIDLLSLAPKLLPVAVIAWAALALRIARKPTPEWAWLFGCSAIIIFPRVATYSHTLSLPLVLFFIHRWGWLRGLLYGAVLVGPLPWLLRVAPWMPNEQVENLTHYSWAWVTMVVLALILSRRDDAAE